MGARSGTTRRGRNAGSTVGYADLRRALVPVRNVSPGGLWRRARCCAGCLGRPDNADMGSTRMKKILAGLVGASMVLAAGAAADRKSTRLNSSHTDIFRMPSSA